MICMARGAWRGRRERKRESGMYDLMRKCVMEGVYTMALAGIFALGITTLSIIH